jgi:hypothetical protein
MVVSQESVPAVNADQGVTLERLSFLWYLHLPRAGCFKIANCTGWFWIKKGRRTR